MVKHSTFSNPILTIKLRMPLKTLLLWYKKFKEYVTLLKNNKKKNIKYPTIYVSKKYSKIDLIGLLYIPF